MRGWRRGVMATVAALALTACEVPRPAGEGMLRYRDVIAADVTRTSNLEYGRAPSLKGAGDEVLRLDLFEPAGEPRTTPRPALVWVHGGGFTEGAKNDNSVAIAMARRGFVGVSIDYRLVDPADCDPANLASCAGAAVHAKHDAQAAVRWLRAHAAEYGIDPERIAISGGSAGSVAASMVAMWSEDVGGGGTPGVSSRVGAFVSVAGGIPGAAFATADDPPALLFHGTADTYVPYRWSVELAAGLLKVGVPAIVQLSEGNGHAAPPDTAHFHDQIAWFLYGTLDLAHAARGPS